MSLTLVSFNICPYVLRVVAALNHLQIPYEIKYIDLENKPEWFVKASPLEKVPILLVGDKVVFESLVILDYINTLTPHSLLPTDNLERALNRARAEFSGEVIGTFWRTFSAKSQEVLHIYNDSLSMKV
jgi:glutathione S-transferase